MSVILITWQALEFSASLGNTASKHNVLIRDPSSNTSNKYTYVKEDSTPDN